MIRTFENATSSMAAAPPALARRGLRCWHTVAMALAVLAVGSVPSFAQGGARAQRSERRAERLDAHLEQRLTRGDDTETERVIITMKPGTKRRLMQALQAQGGRVQKDFSAIDGFSGELPRSPAAPVAPSPGHRLALDRRARDVPCRRRRRSARSTPSPTPATRAPARCARRSPTPTPMPGPTPSGSTSPARGVRSITVSTALPSITSPVVIDGWSNPGYTGTPVIELNGGNAGHQRRGTEAGRRQHRQHDPRVDHQPLHGERYRDQLVEQPHD